ATGKPNTAIFRARTRDNPFLPPEFYANLKEQYVARTASQELDGEFLDQGEAEWPASYFGPGIWFENWPKDLTIKSIGLDPSKGKDAKWGDYSAIVRLGRDTRGTLWCDADLQRRTVEQIVEDAIEHQHQFQADVFAVEANQFQELLATQI